MSRWASKGDYWHISFVTHDKKPVKGSCSVRKGLISVNELNSIHRGKLPSESGA